MAFFTKISSSFVVASSCLLLLACEQQYGIAVQQRPAAAVRNPSGSGPSTLTYSWRFLASNGLCITGQARRNITETPFCFSNTNVGVNDSSCSAPKPAPRSLIRDDSTCPVNNYVWVFPDIWTNGLCVNTSQRTQTRTATSCRNTLDGSSPINTFCGSATPPTQTQIVTDGTCSRTVNLNPSTQAVHYGLHVVFVVDNSESMAEYQDKLSTAASQLVNKLGEMNVTTRVTIASTTSDYHVFQSGNRTYQEVPSALHASHYFDPFVLYGEGYDLHGNSISANILDPTNARPVSQFSVTNFQLLSPTNSVITGMNYSPSNSMNQVRANLANIGFPATYGAANPSSYSSLLGSKIELSGRFSLSPSSLSTFAWQSGELTSSTSLQQNLANAIKVGTQGSRVEQGLCSMARLLNDSTTFNSSNERVVFILISDSDEEIKSAMSPDCLQELQRTLVFNAKTDPASNGTSIPAQASSYEIALNVPAVLVTWEYSKQNCPTGDDVVDASCPFVETTTSDWLVWQPASGQIDDLSLGFNAIPTSGFPLALSSCALLADRARISLAHKHEMKNCRVTSSGTRRYFNSVHRLRDAYLTTPDNSSGKYTTHTGTATASGCSGNILGNAAHATQQLYSARGVTYVRAQDLTALGSVPACLYKPATAATAGVPTPERTGFYWLTELEKQQSTYDALLGRPMLAHNDSTLVNVPTIGVSNLARSNTQYKQIALHHALVNKFGADGYHVSFIVNPPDSDIPAGVLTGAKATQYNVLKNRLGANSTMTSIHASNYTPALNDVVTFVENRILSSITLPALNSGETIAMVTRLRGTARSNLNTAQYSISGNVLTVGAGVLAVGDQIQITIKRP